MAENRELALVLKLVADEFQKELKNSQGALASVNNFVKDWRTQMAAAGTALFAVAKSAANYGDELFKTSQKVGIHVEQLAGLQHAAKLADVDTRQLQVGLQALSRAMVDSAQGTGEGKEAFDRVGISATDANGKLRPMHDVLLELSDVFSRAEDGAGKTEVAMKLMGKSGADLIPLLNGGKDSIVALEAEAKRLGLTMSESDARAAEAFNDELTRLEARAKGFSVTIGTHMIRPLTELMSLMSDLGNGPIADVAKFFFRGLNEQIVLFGTLVKEIGASLEFALGKSTFDQLRTKLRLFEAEASAKLLLLENPEAAQFLDGPVKPPAPSGRDVFLSATQAPTRQSGLDHGKEQERLARALLDIWKSQNNALEIQWRLRQGPPQDEHVLERERAENAEIQKGLGLRFVSDTQRLTAGREQEQLGRQILQQTQAQLAIDAQRARESMTFFDQWQEGLKRYAQDTSSGFGFAADLARRTAQLMEQNFRTFFFDLFEGNIKSLKDVMSSFGNFVKQIMSQVLAQLATMMVIKGLKSGFGGGFGGLFASGGLLGGGGFGAAKFAAGGPVLGAGNLDRIPALLTPGEGVLNRKGMQNLAKLNHGDFAGGSSTPNVVVNFHGVQPGEQPQVNYRRQFEGMVVDVFFKNRSTLMGYLG